MKRIISYPIHIVIMVLLPIIFLISHNIAKFEFTKTVVILILILPIMSFSLFYILKLIIKCKHKAAFIVSLFILLFFSFNNILDVVHGFEEFFRGEDVYTETLRYKIVLPVGVFLGFLICCILICYSKLAMLEVTKFLNIFTTIFLLILIVNIASFVFVNDMFKSHHSLKKKDIINPSIKKLSLKPDIYYIIPDQYLGFHALKEFCNFDNVEFENYLIKKGFYVAKNAHSNYLFTETSTSSFLNMRYFDFLIKELGINSPHFFKILKVGRESLLKDYVRKLGYKWIGLGSYHMLTRDDYKNQAKWGFSCDKNLDGILYWLINMTPLVLYPSMISKIVGKNRDVYLCHLEQLKKTLQIKGPKFVYAHIMAPHSPYLYDRHGNPTDYNEKDIFNEKSSVIGNKAYIDYLIFINKKLKEIIDKIIDHSPIKPIIVLQADHGAMNFPGTTWYEYNGNNSKGMLIDEKDKFSHYTEKYRRFVYAKNNILTAFYLPGKKAKEILYDSISPVNNFRIILNSYFNASFKVLDDKMYISKLYTKYPYRFYLIK